VIQSPMFEKSLDCIIEQAFLEDLDQAGDITSKAIIPPGKSGKARLVAKQAGIIAGLTVAERVFSGLSPEISIRWFYADGNRVVSGDILGVIEGNILDIVQGERIALNFIQRLSGIATRTHAFVSQVAGCDVTVLDTRKTIPGYRTLEKYAVRMGGGTNHRFGLYDMALIKENHIRSAGSIEKAVEAVLEYFDKKQLKGRRKIEVEVTTIDEVRTAAKLEVDRIMFDNFNVSSMKEAVDIVGGKKETEASGNVTLSTIREIAETGVDFISVGSITHSAPSFDVSLLIFE